MEGGIILSIALFLQIAVQMGTPILYGTLGGILCEKVGNLNLGVEGMMLMGAVIGFKVGYETGNAGLALLAAGIAGLIGALIYAIITVTFMGNQTVTGLVLTIFGTGFSSFIGKDLAGVALPDSVIQALEVKAIPGLSEIPILGKMLFEQSIMVWISLALAVIIYILLKKTYWGLNIRAVGENPSAADASGINVTLYKYLCICSGGFLCGLGGAYLTLVFVPRWQENITAEIGWIAVALIIFCIWSPLKAIFGAYFFGALRGIGFKIQNFSLTLFGVEISFATQILDMIPYLATILVLIFITLKKNRENQPPKWLSNPYFREDR